MILTIIPNMIKAIMDTLVMNKLWVKHSHNDATTFRADRLVNKDRIARLQVIGLFETYWMIYKHHKKRPEYGYPNNE